MKIGIITHPLRLNYGGILQNYALQQVLAKMGHSVVTLDYSPKYNVCSLTMAMKVVYRLLLKMMGREVYPFFEFSYNREFPVMAQYLQEFVDKHIARNICDKEKLTEKDFDALVVGSDQVWRAKYMYLDDSFLLFAQEWNIPKIAYAASFGTDEWEYTDIQRARYLPLVKQFRAVSLRERGGAILCKEKFDVEGVVVLDPTLLLSASDYEPLFIENTVASQGDFLCYVLDESDATNAIIEAMRSKRGVVPFMVNSKAEDRKAKLKDRVQPPVEQWLRGFHDADFVFTDSFHACVFSIIFHKQFAVYPNIGRGMARYRSLFEMCGISDRYVSSAEDIARLPAIDYDAVDRRLSIMREKSTAFLVNALERTDGL